MADLGAIGTVTVLHSNPPLTPLAVVTIHRGIHLGTISAIVPARLTAVLHSTSDYVVRQLRIVYRQLWPNHGQRFPQ